MQRLMPPEIPIPPATPDASFQTGEQPGNHCFGCGPLNPQGLHLQFGVDAADPAAISASATIQLTRTHEGAPGFIHGGIIATLLDEAMSKLNRPLAVTAMTRHMEVDYLRPVPVGAPLKIVSHHLRRDGRKIFHTAEIVAADGTVLAKAKGLFVVVDRDAVSKRANANRA
jgi:uncharacterized protein (TIGR00369 family)